MTTLVFIAGLEHSGTTLTDLVVGGAIGTCALGEVSSFIDSGKRSSFVSRFGHFADSNLCSCAQRHDACPVWSSVVQHINDNPKSDLLTRYSKVIQSVEKNFGNQIIISDSSKSIGALKTVLDLSKEHRDIKVKVLLAVKDVRNFVSSITRTRKLSIRGQASCFRWWQASNRNFLKFLAESETPFHIVLYEALCLKTQATINGICEFLEVDSERSIKPLNLQSAYDNAHICVGNADMVFRNRNELRYDFRWFNQLTVNRLYAFSRRARHMNEKLLSEYLGI